MCGQHLYCSMGNLKRIEATFILQTPNKKESLYENILAKLPTVKWVTGYFS